MGIAPGIARNQRKPELEAVFLGDPDEADFFVRISDLPTDVWEVDINGLWIEKYGSWLIHRKAILPSRIRLLDR